jgi:hypothetical protein
MNEYVTQEVDPWVRTPVWMLTRVSTTAVVIYCHLARYASLPDGARPPLDRLADESGFSRSTVKRAIAELSKAGAVTVEHRWAEDKQPLPSRYHLRISHPADGGGVTDEPTDGVADDRRGQVASEPRVGSPANPELERVNKKEVSKKNRTDEDSASATSSSRRTRPKTDKRATTLPADWQPTDTHRTYAEDNGLNLIFEVEQFRSWHLSQGSKYVDWGQAFWTRLRGQVHRRVQRGDGRYPLPLPPPRPDRPRPTAPPLEILDDPEALDAFYAQFAPEGSVL